MIDGGLRTARRIVTFAVGIVACVLPLAALHFGQQRGGRTSGPGERMRSDQTRIIERESIRSEMKASANPKRGPEELATLKQVNEDFMRLQILNNEVTKAASDAAPLDYKRIADKSGEMHKRAVRLKNNLVLTEPAKNRDESPRRGAKPPPATTAEDLRSLLLALGEQINSFVTNPYFKAPQTVNPQHIEAASLDLRSIVEMSKEAGKVADKLGRK